MGKIQKVSKEQASNIIDSRKPLGLFYTVDNGVYVGIDNETGDAWTEDFKNLQTCKKWLVDKSIEV